jgi:peptidoglycan/LPS O-acetylase OafA/YrhL
MSSKVGSRLYGLDAMRGIAAIIVVLYHAGYKIGPQHIGRGYLAVDFFIALSGLVLARAYTEDLRHGLGLRKFLWMRILRLYPIFFFGWLLGTVKGAAHLMVGKNAGISVAQFFASMPFNAVMLPTPFSQELFPLNPPSWSLFLELVVNLVFGSILYRLSTRSLFMTCLAIVPVVVALIFVNGDAAKGSEWTGMGIASARVLYAFAIGMVVGRVTVRAARPQSWLALVPCFALALILFPAIPAWASPIYDSVMVIAVLPVVLFAACQYELPSKLWQPAEYLGLYSYPLYIVHFPIIAAGSFLVSMGFGSTPVTLVALVLVAIAAYVAALFDQRVQPMLKQRRLRQG